MNRAVLVATVMLALAAGHSAAVAQQPLFSLSREIAVPAGPGAREPSLAAMPDGRVLLSWTEPEGGDYAVRVATGDGGGWSEPRTVAQADDLFVNWADFPSAVALPDGTVAAQWLRLNGESSYAYDVNVALSGDEGQTWGPALVPHRDGTKRQHGFVTLLPDGAGGLLVIWLDGRNYDTTGGFASGETGTTNAMQLRAATIGADGTLSEETLLDARACTCCQTSATRTGSGKVLVAYRDRTEAEVRDISVLALADGIWSEPAPVSRDGWVIEGCPVNGPAIDSRGARVAVAWFTAADDVPAVKVAFSDDDGVTFQPAVRIDRGAPTGRVDLLQLADGSALASWLEQTDGGEAIYLCRVSPDTGCAGPEVIAVNRQGRTIGFPRMAQVGAAVYIAWTATGGGQGGSPDDDVKIRMVVGLLGDRS